MGGKKIQEPIGKADKEMQSYFERRAELFKEHYESEVKRGMPPRDARNSAWKMTYSDLWAEFNCCFYYCKGFALNAFSDNGVNMCEIYELCRELAAAAPAPIETKAPDPQSSNVFVF